MWGFEAARSQLTSPLAKQAGLEAAEVAAGMADVRCCRGRSHAAQLS